ncbi:MAG: hypothetical protein ACP5PK_07500 [candidate division WOR-3 bacterium]
MIVRLAILITMLGVARAGAENRPQFNNPEHADMSFWQEVRFVPDPNDSTGKKGTWQGWFHQDNVDVSRRAQGIIRARVEGKWQEFRVVELPPDFLKWNFDRRLAQLANIRELLKGPGGGMPEIAGPHNGIVASHGCRRADSYFTINNAVKGMGWLPKPEKLPEMIQLLKSTWNDSTARKLSILESLYQHGAEIFDLTKQSSLELYSQPDFETHTFLNQMTDPGVAIVFLDLPKSYELRAIAQLLHPDDPKLTDYERQAVEYINLVHDYFHGESPRKSIGVIYHIVQVFDNSPGRWRGQRVVPPKER